METVEVFHNRAVEKFPNEHTRKMKNTGKLGYLSCFPVFFSFSSGFHVGFHPISPKYFFRPLVEKPVDNVDNSPGAPYRPTQVSKILLIKSTKSLRNRQISVFLQHTPGPVFPRRRLKESLPKAPGSAPSLALRTAKAGDFLPAETDPALPGTVLQNDSEISILFTDFFLILWYDIFV